MAKPPTRTTILDEVTIQAEPKVQIERHNVDWNTLAEDVERRIQTAIRSGTMDCQYFNPAVTVTCPQPSSEFFRIVRGEQSRWCRQAGNTIPRRIRRSQSSWISSGEWISNKYARYLDRALGFTGLLVINGQLLPRHKWPG